MSKSGQPYLYAVSTPLPVKREIGKYDYAHVSREKLCKSKRTPQPLPHPRVRVRENSGMDQNHRRPLSLNDLRPPPNSPPPPLPTNGKDLIRGDLGGGCRGCAPPWDDLRFSNATGILQKKKTKWFIGVEVEQETSSPPPKKNPRSDPVMLDLKKTWILVCSLPHGHS